MKYSHRILAIIVLLGLVLCVMVYRSRSATEAPPNHDDRAAGASPAGERAAISESAELAALRQEVAQLRDVVTIERQKPVTPDPAKTELVDPEIQALDTQAEQERRHREYVEGVAASYGREPVDPSWSSSKMSVIQTALASNPELRQLVRSVECRSQTCRMEVADEASGKPSNAVQSFLAGLGTELPTAIAERVEQAGRPGSTVFYVGHSSGIQVTVQ
jgi:hypothetical protein